MNNRQKIAAILLPVGLMTLIAVAIIPLIGFSHPWLKYIYSAGAVLTLLARFIDNYGGKNLAIKRLYRIQTMSAICFCISAGLLFYSGSEKDWLAFLTAGAALQIYTLFRIQSEEKKENNKKENKI